MTLAADEHLRAFFNAFADVRLHTLVLLLGHHRSDGGLGICGIADGKGGHRIHECAAFHFVESALGHEQARPRGACLSAVHETR